MHIDILASTCTTGKKYTNIQSPSFYSKMVLFWSAFPRRKTCAASPRSRVEEHGALSKGPLTFTRIQSREPYTYFSVITINKIHFNIILWIVHMAEREPELGNWKKTRTYNCLLCKHKELEVLNNLH